MAFGDITTFDSTRLNHHQFFSYGNLLYSAVWNSGVYLADFSDGSFDLIWGIGGTTFNGGAVAPNGDVYVSVYQGDIYKQTGGTGNFVALGQTSRSWWGMTAAPNGDIYACVNGIDIYKQTGGTGNFVALGQIANEWHYLAAAPNGDIYITTENNYGYSDGDIYKQTGSTGNFVALGQTSRKWWGIAIDQETSDVYAIVVGGGGIYRQIRGRGDFLATGWLTGSDVRSIAIVGRTLYAGTSSAIGGTFSIDLSLINGIAIRYESTIVPITPNYPNRSGIQYYGSISNNPNYSLSNRGLPTTEINWEISSISKSSRDTLWSLWFTSLNKGYYQHTIVDHKKRLLFDCTWDSWQETWLKNSGGIHKIEQDIKSPYAWTPPMFAFYPFISTLQDHCLDRGNDLSYGSGGSISSEALILTEQVAAAYAAGSDSISWFQQKDNSSISLLAQFRTGEINTGAELDIINISDGSNTIRLYAVYSSDSSSSLSSSSSSLGLSSSSSQGLSSSSSQGLSSSSSGGLSSSSSRGLSSSSSSDLVSSSSQGLSSSSSQGLSSSSSGGLSSSSSQGLSSSSGGLSSSSSNGLSSSSSSQGLSSSSLGISSSSSSQGLSSSSSSEGYSLSVSESSSSLSSASTSSNSSSSYSSSSSSSSQSVSDSSSGENTVEITIGLEWTKSGQAAEGISVDEVNVYSNGSPAWYDICGTFDNYNNQFHLYICRAGDTTKNWSYTFDYLYNTTSLTGTPENSLVSDTTPTNYPEDVTWTSIRLLSGDQADIYATDEDKAEMSYAMIIDDFISPIEFNWFRRLFHYWTKSTGIWPK